MTNSSEISAAIFAAMRAMQFLRYNIPEEMGDIIRPLSSEDAKKLQNLHLKYRRGEWTDEDTNELIALKAKAELLEHQLEELLNDNGYTIGVSKTGEKKVTSSKSPLGRRIIFTWQMPEYEEYDGGLLAQQSEEEFLADVMAGAYDDKYDRQYLSHLYQRRELREGVMSDGAYCFVDKQVHGDEELDEDNMNTSDLNII